MTVVARVLPSNWDVRRLLRFLAGLAMLTLAFGAPAPATPVLLSPVSVSVSSVAVAETASVAVSEPAPAPPAVRVRAAARPAENLAIIALASPAVLIGATPRARGERAPPPAI